MAKSFTLFRTKPRSEQLAHQRIAPAAQGVGLLEELLGRRMVPTEALADRLLAQQLVVAVLTPARHP